MKDAGIISETTLPNVYQNIAGKQEGREYRHRHSVILTRIFSDNQLINFH
jgi:hypothetical protein